MNTIWFTSNLRLGDKKVCTFRLFDTVEKMDQAIIEKWNDLVKDDDVVWVLGNFTKLNPHGYRSQLKGKIHLIRGDQDKISRDHPFDSVWFNYLLRIPGGQYIWLAHYPHLSWPKETYNDSWHLYGRHLTEELSQLSRKKMMAVSVDVHTTPGDSTKSHDFGLFSYEEIAKEMASREVKADLSSVK